MNEERAMPRFVFVLVFVSPGSRRPAHALADFLEDEKEEQDVEEEEEGERKGRMDGWTLVTDYPRRTTHTTHIHTRARAQGCFDVSMPCMICYV
jgi:hypothetical protein